MNSFSFKKERSIKQPMAKNKVEGVKDETMSKMEGFEVVERFFVCKVCWYRCFVYDSVRNVRFCALKLI